MSHLAIPVEAEATPVAAKLPQPNGAQHEDSYKISERPFGTKKKLRIVIMGAGISGLNFFRQSELLLENVDVVCYEKNDDIGGTVGLYILTLLQRHKGWPRLLITQWTVA